MVKKGLLQVFINRCSGHLIELYATDLKVLHVVNPHLHAHLLSCALVKLRANTGDCHMTQYDLDLCQIDISIEQKW